MMCCVSCRAVLCSAVLCCVLPSSVYYQCLRWLVGRDDSVLAVFFSASSSLWQLVDQGATLQPCSVLGHCGSWCRPPT
jgi:hypothetical protein